MIRWEARDGLAVATIDRPERRNALNAELCGQLTELLGSNRSERVVVLTGEGSAFCAGADLVTRFADGEAADGGRDTFRPAFDRLCDAVEAFPAPVIAAVNGPAMGAGMQLAVACDLRVSTPGASFAIPTARLGVHLSAPNLARIASVLGQSLARDVLLGNRVLTGAEAAAAGFVHRVDVDARTAALAWAEELAALAPLTLAGHKRALNLLTGATGYGPASRAEVEALEARAFASDDLREGMAAFSEKRPPRFEGR